MWQSLEGLKLSLKDKYGSRITSSNHRIALGLTLAAHGYNKFFKGGKLKEQVGGLTVWGCAWQGTCIPSGMW
ncbi:MAG: hypothetical protein CM15mP49_35750 [Actinomycetota bacterium]|nr:MAG: hypothetical protein CM15mP49_35750 [Actinomycetota bacterium]